jgi:hypothetical protein
MATDVEGYVCPFSLQSLCFQSSLSVSDWSSWTQAIGSIVAILAAVAVGVAQHRSAMRIALKVESDRRELMCVRALLAAEGFLSGLRSYGENLQQVPPGSQRAAMCVKLGASKIMVPMDLDSLAFLVLERAQDVLNDFSLLNVVDEQWQHYRRDLVAAVRRPGGIDKRELAERVGDIEQLVTDGLVEVPARIVSIRTRIAQMHPEWSLPSIQPS